MDKSKMLPKGIQAQCAIKQCGNMENNFSNKAV